MLRYLPIFTLLAGNASAALAHDFWLQPQMFAAAPNTVVPFTIQVGHGTFRQRWGAPIDRILRFDDIGPGRVTNLRTGLQAPGGADDGSVRLIAPGTHVLVLETNHAESELPSIRFNDYIKVEGMTPAIAWRDRLKLADTPGREIYSRRAKALVQVGPLDPALASQATRPVGLTLEIVPQRNPYALTASELLPVQIIYEGKPLAGALVKLNNLDFDARPIESHLTDLAGRATFNPPRRGKWQLNVIWTKPISGNPKAEFETIFSSLTFGFPATTPVAVKVPPGPS